MQDFPLYLNMSVERVAREQGHRSSDVNTRVGDAKEEWKEKGTLMRTGRN